MKNFYKDIAKPSLRFCQNEEDNLLSKETVHLEQTEILHSQYFENVNQTGNHNSEMKMMASLHEEMFCVDTFLDSNLEMCARSSVYNRIQLFTRSLGINGFTRAVTAYSPRRS